MASRTGGDERTPAEPSQEVTYRRHDDGTLTRSTPELTLPPRTLVTSDGQERVTRWDWTSGVAANVIGPDEVRLVDHVEYRYRYVPAVPDTQLVTPVSNVVEVREKRVTGCHGGVMPVVCGVLSVLSGGVAAASGYALATNKDPSAASVTYDSTFLAFGVAGLAVFTWALLTPDSPDRILYGSR